MDESDENTKYKHNEACRIFLDLSFFKERTNRSDFKTKERLKEG